MPIGSNYATAVTSLSPKKWRAVVPKAVLDSAGWTGAALPSRLVGELLGPGRLRLYPAERAEERVSKITANLAGEYEEPELTESLQVLADRFHSISFSAADGNRITLPQQVVTALLRSPDQNAPTTLFVQAGSNWIDIMTNDERMARLAAFQWPSDD